MADTWQPGVPSDGDVPKRKQREAVGYLAGRGGVDTLTPDATMADIRRHFAELRGRVDALEAEALALEEAMAGTNEALFRTQPPMFKRTAIRWWIARGGGKREPVAVQELGGAKGRVKPTLVDQRVRLRTDRGFGLCADLAKQAFKAFWTLKGIRKQTHANIAALSRVLKPVERRGAVIARVRSEMAEVVQEARGRLRDVGYDVPAEDSADG